jgi:transcriptional regulator of arginine metabolism
MKVKRQSKIVELIKDNEIETQDKLVEMLNAEGFNVTQATISRDIRELKLTKVSTGNGGQKYAVLTSGDIQVSERLRRVFRDGVISMDYAQNIIVIKTLNGMAMAVAAALDSMGNNEIMGTIAGDDTIFCVVKTEQKAIRLIERLKNY